MLHTSVFAGLGVLCPHIPDVLFQGLYVNDASEVSPKSVFKVKVCAPESSSKKKKKNYKKLKLWHKDLYFAKLPEWVD